MQHVNHSDIGGIKFSSELYPCSICGILSLDDTVVVVIDVVRSGGVGRDGSRSVRGERI